MSNRIVASLLRRSIYLGAFVAVLSAVLFAVLFPHKPSTRISDCTNGRSKCFFEVAIKIAKELPHKNEALLVLAKAQAKSGELRLAQATAKLRSSKWDPYAWDGQNRDYDRVLLIEFLRELGVGYGRLGKMSTARKYFSGAKEVVHTIKNVYDRAKEWIKLGAAEASISLNGDSVTSWHEAWKVAVTEGEYLMYESGRNAPSLVMRELAVASAKAGNLTLATEAAEAINEMWNSYRLEAFLAVAEAQARRADHKEAFETLRLARGVVDKLAVDSQIRTIPTAWVPGPAERARNSWEVVDELANFAIIMARIGDSDGARRTWDEAMSLADEKISVITAECEGNRHLPWCRGYWRNEFGRYLSNLALAAAKLGYEDKVKEVLTRSKLTGQQSDIMINQSDILIALAKRSESQGEIGKAIEMTKELPDQEYNHAIVRILPSVTRRSVPEAIELLSRLKNPHDRFRGVVAMATVLAEAENKTER